VPTLPRPSDGLRLSDVPRLLLFVGEAGGVPKPFWRELSLDGDDGSESLNESARFCVDLEQPRAAVTGGAGSEEGAQRPGISHDRRQKMKASCGTDLSTRDIMTGGMLEEVS
jgi:hypothetical protein